MKYMNHDTVQVNRHESNFDRACDDAYKLAIAQYGIDEYGHSLRIDFDRSADTVCMSFSEYRRVGSKHWYIFETWIERNEEES